MSSPVCNLRISGSVLTVDYNATLIMLQHDDYNATLIMLQHVDYNATLIMLQHFELNWNMFSIGGYNSSKRILEKDKR